MNLKLIVQAPTALAARVSLGVKNKKPVGLAATMQSDKLSCFQNLFMISKQPKTIEYGYILDMELRASYLVMKWPVERNRSSLPGRIVLA